MACATGHQRARNPPTRICGFCAAQAVARTTPQPVPEPAPPLERPSREVLLASIPSPKSLVAHLDQYVIGQDIAKRRLALGVSNHFKWLVDAWDCGAPDPIVADPDLHNVRIEKREKSGVSSSFLPEKMNRHRITRNTGLRENTCRPAERG